MQIVIEIVDEDYNRINSYPNGKTFYPISARLYKAVKDGTPLPKHGRLIDADILRSMYSINRANFNTVVGIQKWIDDAPTIIEGSEE